MSFALHCEPAREQAPLAEPAFARWHGADGDELAATFHHTETGYLVRFLDRADFSIAASDERVTCWPAPGTSPSQVNDLYLNQVVPMIIGHRGETMIHASAVAIAGRAAAFVGQTGDGKSTLAAAFARAGLPFLSDDGIRVTGSSEGYIAHPNRPSFRLWQDSEAAVVLGRTAPDECDDEKSHVKADHGLPFHSEPAPLAALYFLGPGAMPEPTIAPIPTRQALARLMNHTFFLDADDRERMTRHFDALGKLAEAVPSFALDYPRDYDQLPRVIEAVTSHFASEGKSQ